MSASTTFRDIRLASSEVRVERAPDDVLYVRSTVPLGPYPARMTDRLDHWAEHAPERIFVAQRPRPGAEGWRSLTYAQARKLARNIGHALLDRGLTPDRPVAILSGNDLEHALLGLGAMYAGIPYAPIATAYSLVSTDFARLRHIFGLLTPGMIFAANGRQYAKAIEAVAPANSQLVMTTEPLPGASLFSDLVATEAGPELDAAYARVTPDSVVKILFTSGSTALPKGVINTHRMWTSNQEMVRTCWPFLLDEPPVLLEWLPWNHTFAGNKDFGLVLYNGGSLYLDEGKPVPGAYEETIRNLREIAPTIFLNVPKGFEALIPYLRDDPAFAKHFFSRLRFMFYAAASLSKEVWDELERISVQTCGEKVLMLAGLGSTETAPYALWVGKDVLQPGHVGVPAPGLELKLVPNEGKLEARLRGPSITPGYWRQDELTRAAFDEEGFYKLGDALRFIDESDPSKGFVFDGRIAEDFKLATGTWVSVGPLRAGFLSHFAPYVKEVVIAGHDRDFLSALVFPDLDACRILCPQAAPAISAGELLARSEVRAKFEELLTSLARQSTGSSKRIVRVILLDEAPSMDRHELTEKGSVNQRAVLSNRAALVEELYHPSPRVILAQ